MKQLLTFAIFLTAINVAAADKSGEQWNNTTLSDATIKKIQEAKYGHKKCIVSESNIKKYQNMDSRKATDLITKKCAPLLATIRKVYTEAEVPDNIAQRHLKQISIQTSRNVLKSMMFAEATRKAGK